MPRQVTECTLSLLRASGNRPLLGSSVAYVVSNTYLMTWWLVGSLGSATVAVSYFAISAAILVPLVRAGQVRSNRLGTATSAIFFTCAVGHALHAVHPWLPFAGIGHDEGLAAQAGTSWHDAIWALTTAAVGVYYWTLRRTYGRLLLGPTIFEDLVEKQRITELEAAARLAEVQAESAAALQQAEQRFRLAFEHAPIGVSLVSLQLRPRQRDQQLARAGATDTLLYRPDPTIEDVNHVKLVDDFRDRRDT